MSYPFRQARFDYGPRKGPILGFVVHMAEGGGTVGFLAGNPARGVSVHYVIEYSGRIVQMLLEGHASGSIDPSQIRKSDDPDRFFGRAAAVAVLGSWADDPNSVVISLEIEGFAADGPNVDQAAALVALVDDVRRRYPAIGLLGHRDFADYKACPGRLIPWPLLGGHGHQEELVQIDVASPDPVLLDVPAGTHVLNPDGSARLTTPTARTGVLSPFASTSAGGTALRAIVWTRPAPDPDLLLAIYTNAAQNVRPVTPPPVVDCTDVVTRELEAAAARAATAVRTR